MPKSDVSTMPQDNDLFALPIDGRWILSSSRRNLLAWVNSAAVKGLKEWERSREVESLEELAPLVEAISVEPDPVPERTGPTTPLFLGLILSRRCNLACRYCDFHGERELGVTSPELLVRTLTDWALHIHNLGHDELNLHFFGGEPFVEESLVYTAVHRTRALAEQYGLRTHFEASTNGVLSETMLQFVADHFDTIVLSLDGRKAEHDAHRPKSDGSSAFETLCRTADCLSDSPVRLCIRCCVSAQTVDSLPDIATWFCERFSPDVIDFEPLQDTKEAKDAGLSPPDPIAFGRAFIKTRRAMEFYGVPCLYSALSDRPRHTFCPVGQDALILAPNGRISSCYLPAVRWQEKGLDLTVGSVDVEQGLRIDSEQIQTLRGIVKNRARCRNCFCRWSCSGGCLVRDTPPGHATDYTDFCIETRLIQTYLFLEKLAGVQVADLWLADDEQIDRLVFRSNDRLEDAADE